MLLLLLLLILPLLLLPLLLLLMTLLPDVQPRSNPVHGFVEGYGRYTN